MVTSYNAPLPSQHPPRTATLESLEMLFDKEVVMKEKITCIKTIREMTGTGLKEAKDFFEQVVQPTVSINGNTNKARYKRVVGSEDQVDITSDPNEKLAPPMFMVGRSYHQIDGTIVMIIGQANPNTSYETVYSISSAGETVHRYNRRDFGRVTGTDSEDPDPRNLRKL